MESEKQRNALGDYFTLQRGTTYKSQLLDQPGPILLGLATIQRNGGFRLDSLRTYGGESPDKLLVQPGELYASLKDVTQSADLLGAVARLPLDCSAGRLTQDTVKLEPIGDDVPTDYLYWLLRTPQYRSYCRAHATGTTNLGLAREDFLAFPAPEPSAAQRTIAHILGTLDDKIEMNRRMNETLEEMARAIFKSWFVDFDPVRARAEGRDPGLPEYIADLFPDRFEDSELGEIPAGWQVGVFGDVANAVRMTMKPSETPDLEFEHFSLPAFDNGRQPKRELGSAIKSAKYRVPKDAVLLSKLNPEIERVWMVDSENEEHTVCSTEFIVLRAQAPFNRPYLYWLCRSSSFRDELAGLVTGTSKSHQRVQPSIVTKVRTLEPLPTIMEAFEIIVGPVMQKIQANGRQNLTLAAIRDALLPKLLSSEVQVGDMS